MASFPVAPLHTLTVSRISTALTEEPRPPLTLTTLPIEIQIQIFSLACKYEPFIGSFFRHRYNDSRGFVHDPVRHKYFKDSDQDRHISLAFTARSLAVTCKSISAIILGDLLFYKANSCSFEDPKILVHFMRGIKLEKAKAIRSIRLKSSGWYECYGVKPIPAERWENVRNLELQVAVYDNKPVLRCANIWMGLPDQCYRNLSSVTIIYWRASEYIPYFHKVFWHLSRTTIKTSLDASQRFLDFRKILRVDFKMANVENLVTETISHVTEQWDGACKIEVEYKFSTVV